MRNLASRARRFLGVDGGPRNEPASTGVTCQDNPRSTPLIRAWGKTRAWNSAASSAEESNGRIGGICGTGPIGLSQTVGDVRGVSNFADAHRTKGKNRTRGNE